jgi:hypothetical protein
MYRQDGLAAEACRGVFGDNADAHSGDYRGFRCLFDVVSGRRFLGAGSALS